MAPLQGAWPVRIFKWGAPTSSEGLVAITMTPDATQPIGHVDIPPEQDTVAHHYAAMVPRRASSPGRIRRLRRRA